MSGRLIKCDKNITIVAMKFLNNYDFSAEHSKTNIYNFIPEPDNIYDPNAIKFTINDNVEAYVSKKNTYFIHKLLQSDKKFNIKFKISYQASAIFTIYYSRIQINN